MTNATDQSAPRFGEAKIADIPVEHFAAIKRRAHDESHDFFVSIIFDDVLFGSGTLIDAWGTLGVLTTYHLAQRSLDRDPDGILALNIDDRPHRFEIPRCCVEHIPLGVPDKNYLERGLDLSFLKLSGLSIISTLKSKKSFYRIGGKSFDDSAEMDPAKLFAVKPHFVAYRKRLTFARSTTSCPHPLRKVLFELECELADPIA